MGYLTICGLCGEETEDWIEVEEDAERYCHKADWVIPGGTCWEKRIVEDFPEAEPWLHLQFDCDGCEIESGDECICTTDSWL